MKKSYKLLSGAMAIVLLASSTPVFANELEANELNNRTENIVLVSSEENLLSPEKEKELKELVKEFNLSPQDEQEIRELYRENSNTVTTRAKIGVIKKIIKVAKPVFVKAAKLFGVKISEKSIADFSDFLFGWQDDLENGIKTFLVKNLGWNSTAAEWTAKTIMFVAF